MTKTSILYDGHSSYSELFFLHRHGTRIVSIFR